MFYYQIREHLIIWIKKYEIYDSFYQLNTLIEWLGKKTALKNSANPSST